MHSVPKMFGIVDSSFHTDILPVDSVGTGKPDSSPWMTTHFKSQQSISNTARQLRGPEQVLQSISALPYLLAHEDYGEADIFQIDRKFAKTTQQLNRSLSSGYQQRYLSGYLPAHQEVSSLISYPTDHHKKSLRKYFYEDDASMSSSSSISSSSGSLDASEFLIVEMCPKPSRKKRGKTNKLYYTMYSGSDNDLPLFYRSTATNFRHYPVRRRAGQTVEIDCPRGCSERTIIRKLVHHANQLYDRKVQGNVLSSAGSTSAAFVKSNRRRSIKRLHKKDKRKTLVSVYSPPSRRKSSSTSSTSSQLSRSAVKRSNSTKNRSSKHFPPPPPDQRIPTTSQTLQVDFADRLLSQPNALLTTFENVQASTAAQQRNSNAIVDGQVNLADSLQLIQNPLAQPHHVTATNTQQAPPLQQKAEPSLFGMSATGNEKFTPAMKGLFSSTFGFGGSGDGAGSSTLNQQQQQNTHERKTPPHLATYDGLEDKSQTSIVHRPIMMSVVPDNSQPPAHFGFNIKPSNTTGTLQPPPLSSTTLTSQLNSLPLGFGQSDPKPQSSSIGTYRKNDMQSQPSTAFEPSSATPATHQSVPFNRDQSILFAPRPAKSSKSSGFFEKIRKRIRWPARS